MVNKRRGEISLTLNEKPRRLVLTLGALAELEHDLNLQNIGQLADRFAQGQVRMTDLVCILGAALRAGGLDVSNREAGSMQCEGGAPALTRALVDLLHLTFGGLEDDKAVSHPDGEPNPLQAGSGI